MPSDVIVLDVHDLTHVKIGVSSPGFIISGGNGKFWIPIAMYEYFSEDADTANEIAGVSEVSGTFAELIESSTYKVVVFSPPPPGSDRKQPQQTNGSV